MEQIIIYLDIYFVILMFVKIIVLVQHVRRVIC